MHVVFYDHIVKTVREEKSIEYSDTSIRILSDRLDKYFVEQGLDIPWYPDNYSAQKNLLNLPVQNIVLFGGFFKSFLESGNWPIDSAVRFWCLSSRVQKIFQEVLGCGDNFISLIPRYDLFTKKVLSTKKNKLNLVYAGRLSESKNTKLLLAVYNELEKLSSIECSLDLFGFFDDGYSYNYGRRKRDVSYELELKNYINKKTWIKAPKIHGWKESREWLEESKDKTFITLSEFVCEDFGVAIAEAQENGMPIIVSDWGGHGDVNGRVLKIPYLLLNHGVESEQILEIKAKVIARYILDNLQKLNTPEPESSEKFHIPRIISISELDQIRRQLIKNLGMDLLFTHRIGFDFYADTEAGSRFFSKYNKIFGNKKQNEDAIFILNDIDGPNEIAEEIQRAEKICFNETLHDVDFISLRYLFRLENLERIVLAKRLFISHDFVRHENIFKRLEEIRPDFIFY